jgi:hypothetical protein
MNIVRTSINVVFPGRWLDLRTPRFCVIFDWFLWGEILHSTSEFQESHSTFKRLPLTISRHQKFQAWGISITIPIIIIIIIIIIICCCCNSFVIVIEVLSLWSLQ